MRLSERSKKGGRRRQAGRQASRQRVTGWLADWLAGWMARARQSKQVAEGPAKVGAVAGRQADRHMSRGSLDGRRHTHNGNRRHWPGGGVGMRCRIESQSASQAETDGLSEKPRSKRRRGREMDAVAHESRQWTLLEGRKPITQSKSAVVAPPETPARPAKMKMASNQQHGEALGRRKGLRWNNQETDGQTDRRIRVTCCHVDTRSQALKACEARNEYE